MWLSLIWFISFLFFCWNLFCTIANLRIKCATETKNVSVLFYKILKSSFLHDSHIWLWGFFTLLDGLAHGGAFSNVVDIICPTPLRLRWIGLTDLPKSGPSSDSPGKCFFRLSFLWEFFEQWHNYDFSVELENAICIFFLVFYFISKHK